MIDSVIYSRLGITPDAISDFCRRWGIVELSVFGSVLTEGFRPGSDVDVLVVLQEDPLRTLWDFVRMKEELSDLVHREIDLIERQVIRRSRNYIRRKVILSSARVLYAA